jgi:hypothetical protein
MRGPDVRYGCVTLLASPEGGRHPSGNSLLISGTEGTVVVAPSLQVDRRGGVSAATELMAVTRAHEDHVAGSTCSRRCRSSSTLPGSPPSATPRRSSQGSG